MNLKEILPPTIAAVLASVLAVVAGKVIDHIDPPKFFLSLWQDLFVDIWFVWFGVSAFGLYLLGRFLWSLHQFTTKTVPTLMNAEAQRVVGVIDLIEKEMRSRVSADDMLSNQISSLNISLNREVNASQAKLDELIRKEMHARTEVAPVGWTVSRIP